MSKRMLIDAVREDEQRVAVLDGTTMVEADFNSASKTQIKGNIYLARIARVEPSLQAAFVDFGHGKHGFLPFTEIHPDYFQIPVADREALVESVQDAVAKRQSQNDKAQNTDTKPDPQEGEEGEAPEEATLAAETSEETEQEAVQQPASEGQGEETAAEEPKKKPRGRPRKKAVTASVEDEVVIADEREMAESGEEDSRQEDNRQEDKREEAQDPEESEKPEKPSRSRSRSRRKPKAEAGAEEKTGRPTRAPRRHDDDNDDLSDADFEARIMTRAILSKRYKIQEVIKRNQVVLVQAAKEERGDKGAAMTTYLSLPGRYCVLMPNTHRAGGISRRIGSVSDRKRLKSILDDLDVPSSMSLIVRTAGAERTKPEIKRDYAYLSRMWDEIRETTLNSFAPALIYDEANLIKRAIRDIYESDTDEVLVAGEASYKAAKAFMKTLTPSHANRVKHYTDDTPLFQAFDVEEKLEGLHTPTVVLPSGGYLVIHQTEALVAIDVNSGRATRERSIEETALSTNLEAAKETARQLRLRDLAGLIVIDFIDMDENRNVSAVEKALKDALKPDRARIQVGRISQFGLMELSRQRLRPSVAEATMTICPTCRGTGYIKSDEGTGRSLVRQIEATLAQGGVDRVTVFAGGGLALSLANDQRAELARLAATYNTPIEIKIEGQIGPALYRGVYDRAGRFEAFGNMEPETPAKRERGRGDGRGRGRDRNNRSDRGQDRADHQSKPKSEKPGQESSESDAASPESPTDDVSEDGERKKRRRGKRGGRGRGRKPEEQSADSATDGSNPSPAEDLGNAPQPDVPVVSGNDQPEPQPTKPKRSRARKPKAEQQPEPQATPDAKDASENTGENADAKTEAEQPKRRGWWNRVMSN